MQSSARESEQPPVAPLEEQKVATETTVRSVHCDSETCTLPYITGQAYSLKRPTDGAKFDTLQLSATLADSLRSNKVMVVLN